MKKYLLPFIFAGLLAVGCSVFPGLGKKIRVNRDDVIQITTPAGEIQKWPRNMQQTSSLTYSEALEAIEELNKDKTLQCKGCGPWRLPTKKDWKLWEENYKKLILKNSPRKKSTNVVLHGEYWTGEESKCLSEGICPLVEYVYTPPFSLSDSGNFTLRSTSSGNRAFLAPVQDCKKNLESKTK